VREVPANRKLVLVDDDAGVRKALSRLLVAAGFEVESFADAESYLTSPTARSAACLVLDVRMPVLDGFEVQALLARTRPGLPIVFITGHGDEQLRAQALLAGAVEVLFKPVDETLLLQTLETVLAARPADMPDAV